MKKHRFPSHIEIGGILVCIVCVWLILPTYLFHHAEQQADPKFDALNETILAQIPPPNGVAIMEKSAIGGSNSTIHGKELIITYKMGKLTSLDVIQYYQNLLLPSQWKSYRTEAMAETYYRFVKGSACIDLNTFEIGEYMIAIRHDFWSQSFSPRIKPNMLLLNILDVGKVAFSECSLQQ